MPAMRAFFIAFVRRIKYQGRQNIKVAHKNVGTHARDPALRFRP